MSRHILIAEDEAPLADLCRSELLKHGTTVIVARNGKEALEAVQREKFDLILLDLLMPVMDGYAVLAYFKEKQTRIPVVVVLTNLGQDITKAKCRQLGAEDFIVKSDVDMADMWEKVKKYLPVE